MDERMKKKRQWFQYRRDVGEQVRISDLPPALIEAAKAVLKKKDEPKDKFAPEKRDVKGFKKLNSHVILNPPERDNRPGHVSITNKLRP